MIGRTLSHFRILTKIGEGGMGVVYRAEDTKLRRQVALKVLPPELVANEERRLRFLREARAAAAVTHPNIGTIHEVDEADGVVFIAMELVEGKTLRDHIAARPMPIKDALRIATEMAEGLAEAHKAGVIHRDLKPDNVIIGSNGHPKILDFGLAKLLEERAKAPDDAASKMETISGELTREGKIFGTALYMSPEQARGKQIDARSDIFSFGTTLYEMVTGKVPFHGKSNTDILSAIIRDEPVPVSQQNTEIPQELERIISECLEKDPGDRYQHTDQLAVDLRKLRRVTDTGAQAVRTPEAGIPSATERVPARQTAKRLWWAVAVAVAGAAFLAVFLRSPAPLRVTGYTQLTRSQVLFPPHPSPYPLVTDGSRIYFDEWLSGWFEWRQVPVAGGETAPFASPFPANLLVLIQDVTPDRSRLVVIVGKPEEGEGAFWLLPVVGGSPRRLGELVGHQSTWSPDGSQILYVNGPDLYLARSDGTEPLKLLTAPGRSYWPRMSPDGGRIRFTAFDPTSGLPGLWEVSADGSDLRPLLPGWNSPPNECCGSWTPDGTYYVFQATRENRSHIWAIREKGGLFGKSRSDPIQLTTGATHFIRPVIASDGKRILAISWQLRGELVRYDVRSGQFVPHLSSLSAEWLAYSRDNEWVAYVTYPEGDLWRSKSDGTNRLQLTFPPMRASAPAWAPDGRIIAFEGQVPGSHWRIYVVEADGGNPRSLIPEDRPHDSPTWSPDGTSLAFSVGGEGGIHIFDLEAGEVSELEGAEGVHGPSWSPDGRYLAAHSTDHTRLLLFDFATQRWAEPVQTEVYNQYWSRDGQYLYFDTSSSPGATRSVSRLRLRDRALEQIVGLGDVRQVWGLGGMWVGLAPDGSPMLLRDLSIHHIYALELEP